MSLSEINKGLSGISFDIVDGEVQTYSLLPPVDEHIGEIWAVLTSTGIWPFNHNAGWYISNGSIWSIFSAIDISNKVDKININGNSLGSSSKNLSIVYNEQGQITSANEQNIQITESQVDNLTIDLNNKQNILSGTGVVKSTAGTISYINGTSDQYIDGTGTTQTFPTFLSADKLITEVYNETGATLTKGTVVYINGAHGNLPTVIKSIATSDATSAQTLGLIQNDIANNNSGFIIIRGKITDLDTQFYSNGTQLYLSGTTAGTYTSTKPYAPIHLVYIGVVVRSHPTQGIIEVAIQNGFEIDELHNVSAQSPSNNDGLFYNTSTNLWENKSITTALNFTPENVTNKSIDTTLSANSDVLYCSQKAIKTYVDNKSIINALIFG